MGYPSADEEMEILRRSVNNEPILHLSPVITLDELLALQEEVKEVYVEDSVKSYIVNLARLTRNTKEIYLGVSPRASIALMKAAQAYAKIRGRDYVKPDDVQYLAPFVFGHRIILKPEARYEGLTPEEVLKRVMGNTFIPIKRFAEK